MAELQGPQGGDPTWGEEGPSSVPGELIQSTCQAPGARPPGSLGHNGAEEEAAERSPSPVTAGCLEAKLLDLEKPLADRGPGGEQSFGIVEKLWPGEPDRSGFKSQLSADGSHRTVAVLFSPNTLSDPLREMILQSLFYKNQELHSTSCPQRHAQGGQLPCPELGAAGQTYELLCQISRAKML